MVLPLSDYCLNTDAEGGESSRAPVPSATRGGAQRAVAPTAVVGPCGGRHGGVEAATGGEGGRVAMRCNTMDMKKIERREGARWRKWDQSTCGLHYIFYVFI